MRFTRRIRDDPRPSRPAKRGTRLWRFFVLALVAAAFLTAIVCHILGVFDTDHSPTAATMLLSANYTGIMTVVLQSSDPNLFYANQALDNVIYVSPGLEPYQYGNEIDWEIGGRSDTWYLWFQSLRVVGYLANAAEASGKVVYLEKAAEIIQSWYDFHRDNDKPPPFAWDDHATASRSQNVIHFLRACSSLPELHLPDSFYQLVQAMLDLHGSWLMDERNYHPYNHGMMASMALTQLALTFPDLDDGGLWKDTGIARIRERIEDDLSTENVHLEHSAAYHLVFLDLVLRAEEYLDSKGLLLLQPGDRTIEEMKRYLAYLVKPDGRLPMIGDTNDDPLARDYDHPWLVYSLSQGRRGVRPTNNSVVYSDAGVAILRDTWSEESEFLDTTYLFFQSAFHSRIHKHADDLGLVLYSHGEDIFVGPGVYAYDDSKYRQYVTSAQAQNTLTVAGGSYAISSDNVGKAGIVAHSLEEAFDFVQGEHTMYDGVILKRGIILIRPSTILVVDEAISNASHSAQQIWNLAPEAHDLEFDGDGASFLVGENGVHVAIRQLRPVTNLNHHYAEEEPVRGFISPQYLELVPVHQLEFETYGSGVVFVTQITVTGPGEDVPTIALDLDDPYREITVRNDDGTTLAINLSLFSACKADGGSWANMTLEEKIAVLESNLTLIQSQLDTALMRTTNLTSRLDELERRFLEEIPNLLAFAVPSPPADFRIQRIKRSAGGDFSVTLRWSSNPTYEKTTRFVVWYGEKGGDYVEGVPFNQTGEGIMRGTIHGFEAGKEIVFKIFAHNAAGQSEPSYREAMIRGYAPELMRWAKVLGLVAVVPIVVIIVWARLARRS